MLPTPIINSIANIYAKLENPSLHKTRKHIPNRIISKIDQQKASWLNTKGRILIKYLYQKAKL